jgi:hypothetical protein
MTLFLNEPHLTTTKRLPLRPNWPMRRVCPVLTLMLKLMKMR